MGADVLPMAMTRLFVPGVLPCGIARPLPMPVVRVASRSRTASSTFFGSPIWPLAASTFTSSAMASFLDLASRGILMSWGLRISLRRMAYGSAGVSDRRLSSVKGRNRIRPRESKQTRLGNGAATHANVSTRRLGNRLRLLRVLLRDEPDAERQRHQHPEHPERDAPCAVEVERAVVRRPNRPVRRGLVEKPVRQKLEANDDHQQVRRQLEAGELLEHPDEDDRGETHQD